jgi:hypothetical protein
MQFVYQPEGADPIKWDFDPTRLMNVEVETIERHTGLTFAAWLEAVGNSSALAIHGLLYVLLKRREPTLKWDAVQFTMGEVTFELDDDERADLVKVLEDKVSAGEANESEKAALQQFYAEGVEAAEKVTAGKA